LRAAFEFTPECSGRAGMNNSLLSYSDCPGSRSRERHRAGGQSRITGRPLTNQIPEFAGGCKLSISPGFFKPPSNSGMLLNSKLISDTLRGFLQGSRERVVAVLLNRPVNASGTGFRCSSRGATLRREPSC
jgi:hypothetical protein